ncbi:head-to-tail adaptor [Arthrobacter phage Bauer]|uniref:Head-to-tail adaptor n=1 Tax=Arthrobacter phage Bauer TaxID=2985648 RepID=A0A9E7V2G9_9CAUD|nr:head-to-tail adaptor [Arthrobacter phage Bauer]UUG69970.1 head-to-tail adaptor [Arthrobacter phage Zucker]UYM26560.1 head-to-tail adaptor [Arthrobacter phage Bauer]
MASDYATLADLKAHWPALPFESESEAQQKLHEASVEVRANYPEVDQRITVPVVDGGMDPEVPKLVVNRMVKRALDVSSEAPTAGFESIQFGAGPFTMGGQVHNPDGNVYLSAADKRLLGRSRPRRQAFTIHPGG